MSVATVPLGELCGILSGFAWSAAKFNQDKRGVPIIRIQNVDAVLSNDFVYWDEPYEERFVIRQGDLLLTLSGSFRIESWSGPDALLNQRIIKLTPSPKLDRGWLLHVLRPRLGQIERLGKHALVNNVSLGDIRNLAIPLPPLAEQQRIAEVLDRAEALRAKRRAALAQLDSLIQSLFLDLFGDPVTNPKGVNFELLGNHLLFVTSGGRGWAEFYAPTGSRFIRSLDVQMNHLGSDNIAFVAAPDNAEARRTRVQAGDVLLTITGSRIGRVAPVPQGLEGSFISQHVAILRVDSARIEPSFLSFFLSFEAGGQLQIAKAQYGQTKPGLNFEQIRRFHVPVPPIPLQREFARRVTAVEALKKAHRASLAELDALFATLQHRAFRGEL